MTITKERHYFIDWLRVIAIGLLLLYHVAIGFQPWGLMIGFITNGEPISSLWIPMGALNVWRIPLLFFVSGMGVYFSMQRRSWGALMGERSLRILLPYVFGMFCIFPVSTYILKNHYGWDQSYDPNPGHLWFLGNIFAYVVALSPLFYLMRKHEHSRIVAGLKRAFSSLVLPLIIAGAFVGEVMLVKPYPYELYAMTWHGFFLGLIAFFFGFCFALTGNGFWKMVVKWRWLFLSMALMLFFVRLLQFKLQAPVWMAAVESPLWIFAVLGFGCKHLNRPGKTLTYLSEAAYPVYILHMIFLFLGSAIIFPMALPGAAKLFAVLIFTFAGCFLAYEAVRRVNVLRPLFGMKTLPPRSRRRNDTVMA